MLENHAGTGTSTRTLSTFSTPNHLIPHGFSGNRAWPSIWIEVLSDDLGSPHTSHHRPAAVAGAPRCATCAAGEEAGRRVRAEVGDGADPPARDDGSHGDAAAAAAGG